MGPASLHSRSSTVKPTNFYKIDRGGRGCSVTSHTFRLFAVRYLKILTPFVLLFADLSFLLSAVHNYKKTQWVESGFIFRTIYDDCKRLDDPRWFLRQGRGPLGRRGHDHAGE